MTNEILMYTIPTITFIAGFILGRVYRKKRPPINKNYLSDMLK